MSLEQHLTYESQFVKIETLMYNDAIDICSKACASCYKTSVSPNYSKKSKYIAGRTKVGHDSVIEHSNLVIRLTVKIVNEMDIYNLLIECKYLNVLQIYSAEDETIFIIGGSLRGYKYIIKRYYDQLDMEEDLNVSICIESIIEYFLNIWPEYKCFFEDVKHPEFVFEEDKEEISLGMLKPHKWSKYNDNISDEIKDSLNEMLKSSFGKDAGKYPEIIDITGFFNNDNLEYPYFDLTNHDYFGDCTDNVLLRDYRDIYRFGTITIRFVNMSRTATHQLVRHRNAITQQSQRYVDASNTTFTIPGDEDILNKRVTIDGIELTFSEACIYLFTQSLANYKDLLASGISKENARAILSSNVNCEEIYITFTIPNFLKFIELRADPHAQLEIRKYAEALRDTLLQPKEDDDMDWDEEYDEEELEEWEKELNLSNLVEQDRKFDEAFFEGTEVELEDDDE